MIAERPRAVVFDFHGTLSDMRVLAAQDIWVAWRETSRRITYKYIREQAWGRSSQETTEALFGTVRPWQEMRQVFRSYDESFPRKLQPHVVSALGSLAAEGIRTALLTSGEREIVEGRYLRQSGLPVETFDFTHLSEEIDEDRRAGRTPLQGVAARFGISPADMIFVGDEPNDWLAAQESGTGFVAVSNGTRTHEELLASGVPPAAILPDLAGLAPLLGITNKT